MAHEGKGEKERNQGAASEGKDQRQGKQDPGSVEKESATPAGEGRFDESDRSGRDEVNQINTVSQARVSIDGAEALREEELSGPDEDTLDSANYSDTDEDEDEGLGDGNLGRSVRGEVEG